MIGEASSDYQIFFYNPCTDLICDSGEQGAVLFNLNSNPVLSTQHF